MSQSEPSPLPADILAAVDAERSEVTPLSETELDAAWQDLAGRLAVPPGGSGPSDRGASGGSGPPVTASGAASSLRAWAGRGAWLLAGVLVALVGERALFHSEVREAAQTHETAESSRPRQLAGPDSEGAVRDPSFEGTAPPLAEDEGEPAAGRSEEVPELEAPDLGLSGGEAASASPRAAAALSAPMSRLRRERSVLDAARSALSARQLDDAGRALARHRASFPSGQLAEERRSMAVELVAARGGDVAAALEAFRSRHPSSPYLRRLERLDR